MLKQAREIRNILFKSGRSASDMTHKLKVLGNGSMEEGLTRIGKYFSVEGNIKGVAGIVFGGVVVFAATSIKQHREEGKKILEVLQEESIEEIENEEQLIIGEGEEEE